MTPTTQTTAAQADEFLIAGVYDHVDDAAGPGFAADHPRLEPEEAASLVRYLRAGTPVLTTTALRPDVLDPGSEAVVPIGYRTDGRWIWCDAVAYYAERHALAPEPGLREAARAVGYRAEPVTEQTAMRAAARLLG